jgi:SPP1 family predicted phage head-tail adaptor
MRAGALDRRITIQALTVSQGATGGVVETWADLATVWAQWLPGAGNEKFVAPAVYAEASGRFRVRYRPGVTARNRVLYNGIEWDIIDIQEVGRRDGLDLFVRGRA